MSGELEVVNDATSSTKQSATAASIAKLQDQADAVTRKIEMEKRRSDELDKQILAMEDNIRAQRKRMGGVNAATENHRQIEKQCVLLENRLEKALQKFNAALAHNTFLREEIDNVRRERSIGDDIYKKLEDELDEKRLEMAGIIDAANDAYASRDRAQERMAQLKSEAAEEQEAFEEHWKELGGLIEEDRKRKSEFIKRDKTESGEKGADDIAKEGFDEESKLRKKVVAKNWGIAKQVAAQQVSQEKAQSYNEAFKRIQQATGISEIDELVTTFIVANENNHNAMTMVGIINDEMDKISTQNEETKAEIEKYRLQAEAGEKNRKKILDDLDDKLEKTEAKNQKYDARFTAAVKVTNKIKKRVEEVFQSIGCDEMAAANDLDQTEGCTDNNMLQYLSLIEQQITSFVSSRLEMSGRASGKVVKVDAEASMSLKPNEPLKINPPSTGDTFDFAEDEEDGAIFSRQDMKDTSIRRVSRQLAQKSPKDE